MRLAREDEVVATTPKRRVGPIGAGLTACLLALAGGHGGAAGAPFDFLFGEPPPDSGPPAARRRAPRTPRAADIPLPPPRPHFPGDPPPAPDVAAQNPPPAPSAPSAKTDAKPPPATAPAAPTTPLPPPKPADIETAPPKTQAAGAGPQSSEPSPDKSTSDEPSPNTAAATSKPPAAVPSPAAPSSTVPSVPASGPAQPPLPPTKPAELGTTPPKATEVGTPLETPKSGPDGKAPAAAPPTGPVPSAQPPTPPTKPPDVAKPGTGKPAAPAVAPSGATTAFTPRSPEDNPQCPGALAARHVDAPSIAIGPQPDARCTVVQPVRLTGMTLADGSKVEFPENPTVACTTADSFSAFVGDLLVPLAKGTFGAPVTAVWTGPGLECRSRDHIFGAKLSAHGQGLAIDIARLKLADGRVIEVGTPKTDAETGFETAARAGACGYFHTVLGPGSDTYHRTHWHFDLEVRGAHGDSKYCK